MSSGHDTPIILSIFAFYVVLVTILGLIGGSILANRSFSTPEDPNGITFLTQIGYFFSGIGFVLSNVPLWANTILFLPLSITVAKVVLNFFRGI